MRPILPFFLSVRITVSVLLILLLTGCNNNKINPAFAEEEINSMLDSFNIAAAEADFAKYFSYYAEDGVFIGTDATEYWDKESFMVWAKPIFDRGRAWNFTSIDRNIYLDSSGEFAWFDELLSTQMKICRGSGVLIREGNDWKVKQYVLSMTIPNDLVDTIVELKAPEEDEIIKAITDK